LNEGSVTRRHIGATWRIQLNRPCGGDAALCQITLTTCELLNAFVNALIWQPYPIQSVDWFDDRFSRLYKSSAAAEMGDRSHNRHGRKEGAAVPPLRTAGTPSNTMWPVPRSTFVQVTSSSIQPFGHNRHGPKVGWGGCAFFSGVAGSHRTQSRLSQGLPPYQVAS